jgi:putative hydrolase of the HAD superfamily
MRFSDVTAFGLTAERAQEFFSGVFRAECLIGRRDTRQALEEMAAEQGFSLDLDRLFAHWHADQSQVRMGVVAELERLRGLGVHLVLATNQEQHRMRYMRTVMGYDGLFDQTFCSSELGVCKPDPLFFQGVTEALPVGSVVRYIDDDARNVASATEACGWQGAVCDAESSVMAQLRRWWA